MTDNRVHVSIMPRAWEPARDGGRCRGTVEPETFFPDLYNDDAEVVVPSVVLQTCDRCPVKDKCLKWAMDNDAYGFWAGTSRFQRLQLGRDGHRVKCPGCSSTSVTVFGRNEICISCGITWSV